MQASVRVGLIGVGLMGHGIASNLLRAGYPLTFLEHPGNQPVEDLLAAGAASRATAAEVAADAGIVLLCVTGTPQVEAVLFGEAGVTEGLQPGGIVIDCSTSLPSATVATAERIAAHGGRFLDAAMTRTPKEAAEGRLNLIVGAPDELLREVRPVLDAFAERITHVGPVSTGHQVKLLHNFVSLGFSAVLAEAAAVARRAGIAPAALAEVLGSGGGAGVVFERLKPYILEQDPSGFRFTLANALKDMGYYDRMARELGGPDALAGTVEALYRDAVAADSETALVPELIRILAGDSE